MSAVCITFENSSPHPDCLDEAMQTWKKCSISFYCFHKIVLKNTRESKATVFSSSHLNTPSTYRPMRARVVARLSNGSEAFTTTSIFGGVFFVSKQSLDPSLYWELRDKITRKPRTKLLERLESMFTLIYYMASSLRWLPIVF